MVVDPLDLFPPFFVAPTNGSVPALILWLPLSFHNNDLVFCGTHCLKYRPDLAFLCHPLSFSDNDKTDVTYHHYSSWHSTLRIVVLAPLKKVSFLKIKQNIVHPAGDVLWVFVEPGNVVP